MLTPQRQQPITHNVMERFLDGADALPVATTLARRMSRTSVEGVAIEAFVLHQPRDGVLTNVVAGDAASLAAILDSQVVSPSSGVLYIDIDRFKAINDTHGHTVVAEPLPDGLGVDQVTASVGAAMGTGDVRDLVSAADLAMLTGKRRGRNVLTTAGVPVGSP